MPITLAESLIFIVGQERSGTTLLMAMLGCHPRIAVPEVAWWYPRFRPYFVYVWGPSEGRQLPHPCFRDDLWIEAGITGSNGGFKPFLRRFLGIGWSPLRGSSARALQWPRAGGDS